jgi:translation initiation factor IF-3
MSTVARRALQSLGRLCQARGALAERPPGPAEANRAFATVPLARNRRKSNARSNNQETLPLKNDEIRNIKELRVIFPDDGAPSTFSTTQEKPETPATPATPSAPKTIIMPLQEAKEAARALNLDLVMASPSADPPVARITVWEKMIYNMRQKQKAQERAAREHRKLASPKEVRIGCHIAPHDLETKLSIARKILESHQLLKLSVTFKGGREIDAGKQVLDAALESLQDVGKIKDPKHMEKAMMNRWAVQLEPIANPSPT